MNFNKINVLLKMGRYFGIGNSTKKQQVSSYWKSDEFCNCYQVMHQMHWNKTDKIYSGCYDTCCEFKYDVENDVMNVIDVTDKMYQEYEENNDKEKEKEEKDDTIETKQYGFDTNLCKEELDHVPEWFNNKCTKCDFVYDESMLKEYAKNFDGCFFMN